MDDESTPEADDERPPICPACGVTMGIVVDEDGTTRYICLECGFSDETMSCGSTPALMLAVRVLPQAFPLLPQRIS